MPALCIVTQYFPPEMGAPQARLSELGERLLERGWDVEVLTALPSYPTGRIFPGYPRRRVMVEQIGRLRTVRVPLLPSQQGFARRVGSYLSFAVAASALGPAHCRRPDLLWVESPPLFTALAGRTLGLRWRVPFVFNVSDLWPESALRMGVLRPGPAAWLAQRLELEAYRSARAVTAQSDDIAAAVRRRAPDTPVAVVTNGVEPARFGRDRADAAARALLGPEPGPVFVYAGLLGLAQGLEQLLALASALPPEAPGRIVLVGDGPARADLERSTRANPRVRLVPAQPRERIPALLACADVAVVPLGLSLPGAVPSKIYEAMAAGLPILLVADGEAARRVTAAGCGRVVAPRDAEGLRQAFLALATDAELRRTLGAAGRAAAERDYSRARIADGLDGFLRAQLQPGRSQ